MRAEENHPTTTSKLNRARLGCLNWLDEGRRNLRLRFNRLMWGDEASRWAR